MADNHNVRRKILRGWDLCARDKRIIEYTPVVETKKLASGDDRMDFYLLRNVGRNTRPQGGPDCPLCKNLLELGSGLHHTGTYQVSPNGWPIIPYHMVAVREEECPQAHGQDRLEARDLEEMLEYAQGAGQLVIKNTFGAAATQHHGHFQTFERVLAEIPSLPIESVVPEPYSANGRVQHRPATKYPGANFVFEGKAQIPQVLDLVRLVRDWGHSYTLLILDDQISVIPRRPKGEIPPCTKSRIGGYECSGVIVVPTQEIYDTLTYADVWGAMSAALVPWNEFSGRYRSHALRRPSVPV